MGSATIALHIVGDDYLQWVARVEGYKAQDCCTGHDTPEEAASHGCLLAATFLCREVHALEAPTIGALALGKGA